MEITKEQDVEDPDDFDDPDWEPKKTSVFWPRKKDSDMKSLMDSEKGVAKIFELDWAACLDREPFTDLLVKNMTVCDGRR